MSYTIAVVEFKLHASGNLADSERFDNGNLADFEPYGSGNLADLELYGNAHTQEQRKPDYNAGVEPLREDEGEERRRG